MSADENATLNQLRSDWRRLLLLLEKRLPKESLEAMRENSLRWLRWLLVLLNDTRNQEEDFFKYTILNFTNFFFWRKMLKFFIRILMNLGKNYKRLHTFSQKLTMFLYNFSNNFWKNLKKLRRIIQKNFLKKKLWFRKLMKKFVNLLKIWRYYFTK